MLGTVIVHEEGSSGQGVTERGNSGRVRVTARGGIISDHCVDWESRLPRTCCLVWRAKKKQPAAPEAWGAQLPGSLRRTPSTLPRIRGGVDGVALPRLRLYGDLPARPRATFQRGHLPLE